MHRHARSRLASVDACVFAGEAGERGRLTYAELSREVTRFAEGLAALGVGAGDRVGLYLPMSPEVAIASTPARTSARCRCRSSPASPLPRWPSASRTPR